MTHNNNNKDRANGIWHMFEFISTESLFAFHLDITIYTWISVSTCYSSSSSYLSKAAKYEWDSRITSKGFVSNIPIFRINKNLI